MNFGETLFAQLMEFVPWTSFARIVTRHGGDSGVRNLSCTEQFRAMAFAQLTYRESLRDIEACLPANQTKLYSMGFRAPVKHSTLADANEARNWRIWEDLATLLIRHARKLYCNDSFGVDLTNAVYALDATTIDLCLSLFPWAPFRTNKAAQTAYPAGFARQYSGFHPHHGWQDPRSQRAGYLVLRGRGFLRDGSGLSGFQSPVHAASVGCVLRNSRQTRNERAQGVLDEGRSKYRHHLRSAHRARRFLHLAGLSRPIEAHPLQRTGNRQDVGVPDQQHGLACTHDRRAVQKPLASRVVLQVDQATSAYQTFHRQQRERGENANLVRHRNLRADRHCQKGASN